MGWLMSAISKQNHIRKRRKFEFTMKRRTELCKNAILFFYISYFDSNEWVSHNADFDDAKKMLNAVGKWYGQFIDIQLLHTNCYHIQFTKCVNGTECDQQCTVSVVNCLFCSIRFAVNEQKRNEFEQAHFGHFSSKSFSEKYSRLSIVRRPSSNFLKNSCRQWIVIQN